MAKQYKSDALAAAHETALGLTGGGRHGEAHDEEIRALRRRENVSQAAFVRYLNVTTSLVSQWERGEKRPRGAPLKLLTLVAKRRLLSDKADVDVERGQGHGDRDADVAVDGGDLETQEQSEREHEVEAGEGGDMSEDFQRLPGRRGHGSPSSPAGAAGSTTPFGSGDHAGWRR